MCSLSSDAVLYQARTLRAAKPAKMSVLTQWYCIRIALPALCSLVDDCWPASVLQTASLLLSYVYITYQACLNLSIQYNGNLILVIHANARMFILYAEGLSIISRVA